MSLKGKRSGKLCFPVAKSATIPPQSLSGFPHIGLTSGTKSLRFSELSCDVAAVVFLLGQERRSLLLTCHVSKCHVIPYLFVYSVPSWGPHQGCRLTQLTASYLLPVLLVLIAGPFVLQGCCQCYKMCFILINSLW